MQHLLLKMFLLIIQVVITKNMLVVELCVFPGLYNPHAVPKQSFFYPNSRVWVPF